MATIFKFKCAEFTAVGTEVFVYDKDSQINELQVVCVSGTITIEGTAGEIMGKPTSPIALSSGQAFNFNEIQYEFVQISVSPGTICRFIVNN
jgi:hypothetical protein